ncbi:MAG: aminotransferase class I/II-fold pyridoxal phosphate-dependent enzyme [SAR324 cluster bacterium]
MRFARTRNLQLSPIKEVELAAARRPGTVSLAQGIPSFDTPAVIKEYVKARMDEGAVARYSLAPGLVELRERVAEDLARDRMSYDPDGEILITVGSIEGIAATLMAVTEPGDEILLPSPSYASYQQVIRMVGCEPVFVPLDEERNFDLDVDQIARRISSRTAALFYCNPNNPTGTLYTREQSLRMMELAERHDLTIVTDEVYRDFIFGERDYFSPAQVPEFRDRVVRIFSLSKAYAMTGWRIGYLHSSRRVVTEILKVHDSLVTCAPVISQYAAIAALTLGRDAVAEFRRAYLRRRDLMLTRLDRLSHAFDYQKPSGAYFVFPRVKDTVPMAHDSRALALDILDRAGVAVVPGSAFGPTGESHLRLSYGRDDAEIVEAFRRLDDYFAGSTGRPVRAGARPEGRWTGHPIPAAPRPSQGRVLLRRVATAYLRAMARLYLRRVAPQVIAIAGNRGKTVVKRVLTGLLEAADRPVRANPRSYNTSMGVPLAVLGLEIDPRRWTQVLRTLAVASWRACLADRGASAPRLLVLELGARRTGDMAELLRTVRPDWAIVTPLGTEGEPEELECLRGEMETLTHDVTSRCGPFRLLVAGDDVRLAELAQQSGMALCRDDLVRTAGGFRVQGAAYAYLLGPDIVGESGAFAVLAAIALGERLGLDPAQLQRYLTRLSGRTVETKAAVRTPVASGTPVAAIGGV